MFIKYLENSGLLIKGVTETVENEEKQHKGGFLGTLVASLLGNMIPEKGVLRAGKRIIRAGKETVRAGKSVLWAGEATVELVRIFNATSSFN